MQLAVQPTTLQRGATRVTYSFVNFRVASSCACSTLIGEDAKEEVIIVDETPWGPKFGVQTPIEPLWMEKEECWGWLCVAQHEIDVEVPYRLPTRFLLCTQLDLLSAGRPKRTCVWAWAAHAPSDVLCADGWSKIPWGLGGDLHAARVEDKGKAKPHHPQQHARNRVLGAARRGADGLRSAGENSGQVLWQHATVSE